MIILLIFYYEGCDENNYCYFHIDDLILKNMNFGFRVSHLSFEKYLRKEKF